MTDDLHPEESERYLLALLLTIGTRSLAEDALITVAPEDFWCPHTANLWKAARALLDTGERITRRALRGACSTPPALARLTSAEAMVPRTSDYAACVAEVRRCGQLRRMDEALIRIRQRAHSAEDFAQAMTWAHDELAKLDVVEDHPEAVPFGTLLDEWLHDMTTDTPRRVFPTPWDALNAEIAGGMHGGRFYVVGARPGEGKSIAAHNLAAHAAALGHRSLVFSMEMGRMEVTGRIVASGAQIEMREVSRRLLSADSLRRVYEYADRARSHSLSVVDRSDVTMPFVRSVCRTHSRRHGLDVVVVDYLQLITPDASVKSREQQVAQISRQLKLLSRELDVAVVVPAQLNRGPTARANSRPMKSDLRESGGIEADADVVMLLSRGVFPSGHEMAGEPNGELDIYIDKNRHGRECHLSLPWRAHYATIG